MTPKEPYSAAVPDAHPFWQAASSPGERLGHLFFRLRGWTPLPILLFLFWQARPTTASLLWGTAFIVLGEWGRLSAAAFSGRATRTAFLNAPRLITEGPFARVRNPIYLSNLVMYGGTVLQANVAPLVLPATLVYFAVQYYFIVLVEEKFLQQQFGSLYQAYCHGVPAWQPRISRGKGKDEVYRLSWKETLRAERSSILQAALVAEIMLLLKLWR